MGFLDFLESINPLHVVEEVGKDVLEGVFGKNSITRAIEGVAEGALGIATGDYLCLVDGAKDLFSAASGALATESCNALPRAALPPNADRILSQGYASSATAQASDSAASGDYASRMNNAVLQVQRHFDLLDTAQCGGSRDGKISCGDLQAAANNPGLPPALKDACQFLVDNDAAFKQIAAERHTNSFFRNDDAFIKRDDIDAMAAKVPASPLPGNGGAPCPEPAPASGGPGPAMDAATASGILLRNFELIDSPTGDGRDGVSRWEEVQYVHDQTSDPQLKAAIEFFQHNPGEFHLMENLGSGKRTLNDGVFSVEELRRYHDLKVGAASGSGAGASSGPTTSQGASTESTDAGGGPSAATSSKASTFKRIDTTGMSPEQIVEALMLNTLDNLDSQLEDVAGKLQDAQESQAAFQAKTVDPNDAEAQASLNKDKTKANQDVNRLTQQLQDLVQKRSQMFQMLSNISSVTNEMAKAAIQNIGRA